MTEIKNQTFDSERALYGSCDIRLEGCRFDGPADGESACKESSRVQAENCFFNLRYPFWHDRELELKNCEMTSLCRAALWYSEDIRILDSKLHGIKALRECRGAELRGCDILSPEFGWSVEGLVMEDCTAESEYFLMRSAGLRLKNLRMKGKYSFQYIQNAVLENCTLDTKDAFWHAKDVVVRDSVIRGEYLGWYCENVTFERCKIIGTQPLCYCKNLRLIDCEMIDADLAFEKSDVTANLLSPVVSIKNPRSGRIVLPAVGEVIRDDEASRGEVVVCSSPQAHCHTGSCA